VLCGPVAKAFFYVKATIYHKFFSAKETMRAPLSYYFEAGISGHPDAEKF